MPATGGEYASLIGNSLGEYEVQALIGRGAMGTVYLARDVNLNRNVALKVLLGNLANNETLVRQFHLEAQAAAPLRHPNIVQIYSAGVLKGIPFIAMEFIEGEPLDRFLHRQGRLPWQTALYIGLQMARALECAHRHGVIHRDVKPANILLDGSGKVRLTDFGIANVVAIEGLSANEGPFLGTPHYMSPEQCAGGVVGPGTDLYSLGVTLYLLVSGRLPFDSDDPVALIKSITDDEPPRLNKLLPDVPDDVARLVAHLMTRNPKERPRNAGAVCHTIERLQAEKGGRSAMPEALLAFMREQTRIRPVRSLIHVDPDGARRHRRPPLPMRALVARLLAVAVCLPLFIGIPPAIRTLGDTRQAPQAPPRQELVTFRDISPQVSVAELGVPGYRFEEVRWIRGAPALLVRLIGEPGSANHGMSGLVAIEVGARKVHLVQTPAGPLSDPQFWQIRFPLETLPPVYEAPGSPVHNRVILPSLASGTGQGSHAVTLVARRWDVPVGNDISLLSIPLVQWQRPDRMPWLPRQNGHVVPRPDGMALCAVLYEAGGQNSYLAEFTLPPDPSMPTGSRLSPEGQQIIPGSVQYAPDNRRLSYLRVSDRFERELIVTDSGGGASSGRPLLLGLADTRTAFSPDSAMIAAVLARTGRPPELHVVSSANGMTMAQLGSATIGAQPWHSSGTFLMATHEGELLAIGTGQDNARVPFALQGLRVGGGAAVSGDGRWVAAILESNAMPALVFLRLDRLTFEDLG
jgi:predicted Ser/Thr protein kinase